MYFYAFYPLGLDVRLTRRPWLSVALMVVMAVAFLWLRYAPRLLPLRPNELIFWAGAGAPWTVVTAIFLHGSWMHLLGNLLYLGVFAPALEDRLGRGPFLLLFLMLGVAGNLAHGYAAVENWLGQGGLGVMGASGAISGLLGLALVRLWYARVTVAFWVFAPLQGQNRAGRRLLPVPAAILAWLLLQLGSTLVARESGATVSYAAHLGGFGLGLALGLLLGHRRAADAEAALQRARALLDRGEAVAAQSAFGEFLAVFPEDCEVERELARCELLGRDRPAAVARYRALCRQYLEQGRVPRALDVYLEARRVQPGGGLSPPELGEIATWFERSLAFADAVKVYQDLVDLFPDHPASGRAWVRIVMLLHGKLDRFEEARHWLHLASLNLPPGAWRDYLAAEFNLPATMHAARAATPAGSPRAPAA